MQYVSKTSFLVRPVHINHFLPEKNLMKRRALFIYTRLGFESLCKQIPKHLNERKICLPNDPKIIICICFGAFWICGFVIRCCPMADSQLILELLLKLIVKEI